MSLTYATVDLSPSNIAFTCEHVKFDPKNGIDNIEDIVDFPASFELCYRNGKPLDKSIPKEIVETATWKNWPMSANKDICLIDFGESFRHGSEPKELAQPLNLTVPETIFTNRFDYRMDLWRAGCVVCRLSNCVQQSIINLNRYMS